MLWSFRRRYIDFSSVVGGVIEYVGIESQFGGKCLIRSPWKDKVKVYRNGVIAKTLECMENNLLSFETEVGERIVLVPSERK